MKIIDEKGKLFGKINIIDLFVLLVLLGVLPVFYFVSHTLAKRAMIPQEVVVVLKEYKEVEINVRAVKLEPKILKQISVGDKEIDAQGNVIAQIISLGRVSPYEVLEESFDIGGNNRITKIKGQLQQLELKMRIVAEVKDNRLYYKEKMVRIDSPLKFKTENYTLSILPSEETIKIKVRFIKILPEVAELVRVGDEEVRYGKDGSRIVEAKVLQIVSNEPHEVIFKEPGNPEWIVKDHLRARDLVLELEVLCARSKEQLFFKGKSIKVGMPFGYSNDLYDLEEEENAGTIIEIIND